MDLIVSRKQPNGSGLAGTADHAAEAETNAEGRHSQGTGHLSTAKPGTEGYGDGTFFGSQDYCQNQSGAESDSEGLGGSGPGTTMNDMSPAGLNCHSTTPGPGTSPPRQLGGPCPRPPTGDRR